MNYEKIYNSITDRAKSRKIEGYREKHHIIPKCVGGKNIKSNIVELTAKEHYLCHFLLTRIYPGNDKLIYAFWMMCNGSRRDRPNTNSLMYSIARELFSKTIKGRVSPNKGKSPSEETKRKISLGNKGKNHWSGRKHKLESRIKQSNSAKNRKTTHENEEKRRDGISKGLSKIVLKCDLNDIPIKEYSSVTEAAKDMNSQVGSIVHAIQRKRVKKHKGFKWKYKEKEL